MLNRLGEVLRYSIIIVLRVGLTILVFVNRLIVVVQHQQAPLLCLLHLSHCLWLYLLSNHSFHPIQQFFLQKKLLLQEHYQVSIINSYHHQGKKSLKSFAGPTQQFPILSTLATSTSVDSTDLADVTTDVIPSLEIVTTYNIISEPIPPPLTSLTTLTTSSTLESVFNEPVMTVAVIDSVDQPDL